MSLSRIDRNAMQRAIALTRAEDNGRREQVDHMRRTDNLEEIGTFCASHCQSRNLGLQPWQTLPIGSAILPLRFANHSAIRAVTARPPSFYKRC